MKTEKMSFKNIKDVLSRDEMKSIMAGSGGINCLIRVQYQTGEFLATNGSCTGSSIGDCNIYGMQNCDTLLYGSNGGCTVNCYYA